jgi:RNA polymerase sigma factor (sigma-70 family)
MKYVRCSFCREKEFEQFNGFGYCHFCGSVGVPSSRTKLEKRTYRELYHIPDVESEKVISRNFSDEDYKIVRQALLKVPEHEKRVVLMHFWKNCMIHEIAERTGMMRTQVEEILESAYDRLRALCLENNNFSRAALACAAA